MNTVSLLTYALYVLGIMVLVFAALGIAAVRASARDNEDHNFASQGWDENSARNAE